MKLLHTKGRFLSWEDGTPFFYLGDTAWELFHRLNKEEMAVYFTARAKQGFTVVQAVALAEFGGVTVPNAYGRLPFLLTKEKPDPERPDAEGAYSYWDHVDYAVNLAAEHGLVVAMLPTWGDKFHIGGGEGPEIFTEENAFAYGKWIGARYRDSWNIIWMLGGDRELKARHRVIVDAMAAGIRAVDDRHLITFHPPGTRDSTDFVGDAPYIDFHTSQTGHGIEQCYHSDVIMKKMERASDKPYMDSEPRYEDHPACFQQEIGWFWDAEDVRQNAYWNVLAGACGHTYGNHCIWSMNRAAAPYFPFVWQEALCHPGAEQMGYVKQLRLRRDYFSLVPAPELLVENFAGMGHMAAAKGSGYAYVYTPLGASFTVRLGLLPRAKQLRALWFDPRTGVERVFAILPVQGETMLAPPSSGKGQDWVLVLEAVD